MRLTLRQLQIFLAVAKSGSTTAAADTVALSQSAASAALNELEGVLEARLFDRVGKRLMLNDNGRLLLPQARQILDATHTIERQFAAGGTAAGLQLHLGASTTIGSYLLPALMAAYRARHAVMPARATIANTADIVAAVANFEVDIGLIEGPCHEQNLHVEPWIIDELIVVSAPHHPLALSGKRVPLKALRDAEWLVREPGSGTREAVEHALIPHLHYRRAACEFSNSEAIKYAAAEGLGISCLSRWVVSDLIGMGKLVELHTTLPKLSRHFYLVYSEQKILSASLAQLLRFCRTWESHV